MSKYCYSDGSVLDYYDYNKVLHRLDGPAVEYVDGSKRWWVEGQRHRLDGPAIEYADGHKEYWIHDVHILLEDFEAHPLRQKYLFEQEVEKVLYG